MEDDFLINDEEFEIPLDTELDAETSVDSQTDDNHITSTKTASRDATVVSICSLKGGVGKTRTVLLLANCLGAAGKKVLVIDLDNSNNSSSYYYLTKDNLEEEKTKNIYSALSDEETRLSDYAIRSKRAGVDIIASDLRLCDLRAIEYTRLKNRIETVKSEYDLIIIDTHPSYDNFLVNALLASDVILTPVLREADSFNTTDFLLRKIKTEAQEKEKCWYLFLNGFDMMADETFNQRNSEYIELFMSRYGKERLTPKSTWFPFSKIQMEEIKDRGKYLSDRPAKLIRDRQKKYKEGVINCPRLYNAVIELAECFVDGAFTKPEAF